MYVSVLFVGFQNVAAVLAVVGVERGVFYRERAAGMYSALPYALGQVHIHDSHYLLYKQQICTFH